MLELSGRLLGVLRSGEKVALATAITLGPAPRGAGMGMAIRWVVTARAAWAGDLFGGGGGGARVVKDGQPSVGG